MKRRFCLGLTGPMASGKGEAVKYFVSRGFVPLSLSDLVREEAVRRGGISTREQMQNLGNELRKTEGAGVLGRRVVGKIGVSSQRQWVIDGIRNPAEVSELRTLDRFLLIGITAPVAILIERMKKRARGTDSAHEELIRKSLEREWGTGEPLDGQQVGRCLELCDWVIENTGTLQALYDQLKGILQNEGIQ